jgi:hypothetical protein
MTYSYPHLLLGLLLKSNEYQIFNLGVFLVLEIKPRALCMLGKFSVTELKLQLQFFNCSIVSFFKN